MPFVAEQTFNSDITEPVDVEYDMVILIQSVSLYRAQPGIATRDMSCMGCGSPLQGATFTILTLIGTHPCQRTGNHLSAVAVGYHEACEPEDDSTIVEAIVTGTAGCFS
jgi:hypothetical protein